MNTSLQNPIEQLQQWTHWQPLLNCWKGTLIPAAPGLYRIRRVGFTGLDYIGQTGTALKKRLGMLKGIFDLEMPYRAPHTAAPALWALRHRLNCDFEVSVLPFYGSKQERKGLEALAIALHRQEFQESPTVNFGRIAVGYKISSSNDNQLMIAGKRFKGGLSLENSQNHLLGIPPVGKLNSDPTAPRWCNHAWSNWMLITTNFPISEYAQGLYRIRQSGATTLTYIGQGYLYSRLLNHLLKVTRLRNEQDRVFAEAQPLECSWVQSEDWHRHQREELENDLIAAHLLFQGSVPPAQFIG
ncbi:hypothetical protein H6F75_26300 [Nodosilinea sp. FACHB-131]|uniref:hypothetical protein n=1 Tax=Cyanophyceae TaxID=3028117 RepID=UPI001684B9AE|nr:hypothetical protein [Nodosilinea sp. FACHB-131]MBD1877001.1 hypothetical protein [Nodosilinea sp. FACHB-131]